MLKYNNKKTMVSIINIIDSKNIVKHHPGTDKKINK